jgi:hypothetical protein
MNTTTTFSHHLIRYHSQTGKRTIVKKFAFNDLVAATTMMNNLITENEGTCNSFHIITIKTKQPQRTLRTEQ